MTQLKWRLDAINIPEWNRTGDQFHCTEVTLFFNLSDVWEHLGFKLKKERCGYAGTKGDTYYCLTRRM